MKKFLLAPLTLAVFGAATAFAGGRPVMYVVVDRVETTQDQSSISMIRIWGSFMRDNPGRDNFGKPIDGYIQFGSGSDKEAPKWHKAAGTGKAVLVGCCGGASAFETVVIHPATEKPKDVGDNVPYPSGHLELFGDMYAGGRDNDRPEVKTLLAFVAAKQKVCPLCGGAACIVAKNPGPQPVDDAFVGQWTIEFANGVVETSGNLVKEGTAKVTERTCGVPREMSATQRTALWCWRSMMTGSSVGPKLDNGWSWNTGVHRIAFLAGHPYWESRSASAAATKWPLQSRKPCLGKWKIAMENGYKGDWKFNEDGTVDSSTNGTKAGKWTINLSKKQVLINWDSDAADKLDLPLNPNSTLGSQVGRNSYKLEAVKMP